ncbi:MAG: citramalate synthase [Planctomycetia bacterium]|nr:citramalate synthase [Planctomycetia bacterium]
MSRIQIYDTTLRDGAQAEGISFSLHDKCQFTRRLDAMGFDFVEGGYPASNEKDETYFRNMREEKLENAKIAAFGMTCRKGRRADEDAGLAALLAAGTKVITLVGKASRYQAVDILRVSEEENLRMIHDSVKYLVEQGREVIFDAEHFFDGFLDAQKGASEYSLECLRAAVDGGAQTLVLCDTNGGSLPNDIFRGTKAVVEAFPGCVVGIHCHNDCDLAVANTLAAVDAGARHVQGCINGFGERCGNANLISILANLALKMGDDVLRPGAIAKLTELSRYVFDMVNLQQPNHLPFVGKSAFAHKGGMHVSAIARDSRSYEHIPPTAVGNESRVLVSELSGRSNIMALAEKHHIANNPKLLEKILAKVVSRENEGYSYEAASGSFDLLVKKCSGTFVPHFELLKYHVNITGKNKAEDDARVWTEAIVKLRVGDTIYYEVADGDGPVNALDAALRKALLWHYPHLAKMHLLDYKVRVINSEAGTAAGVRVVIESRDDTDTWGTVGVSENVVEASWIALTDSFEYKLCKSL